MHHATADSSDVGVQLARAENLTALGDYAGSLEVLCNISQNYDLSHAANLAASHSLLSARNMMQLARDEEAKLHLNSISEEIERIYPKIKADKYVINGVLLRRSAHPVSKSGKIEEALKLANEAIIMFGIAEAAAIMAFKDGKRLLYNAQLNRLYTQGLIFNISKLPAQNFKPLLVEATIAEYLSRRNMTDEDRDFITGMTILADLAFGAGVELSEMPSLSDAPQYHKAINNLFGKPCGAWPAYLLQLCFPYRTSTTDLDGLSRVIQMTEGPEIKPDIIAKALLLGCNMLIKEGTAKCDHRLLSAYATELHYCARILLQNQSGEKIRWQISEIFQRIPQTMRSNNYNWR